MVKILFSKKGMIFAGVLGIILVGILILPNLLPLDFWNSEIPSDPDDPEDSDYLLNFSSFNLEIELDEEFWMEWDEGSIDLDDVVDWGIAECMIGSFYTPIEDLIEEEDPDSLISHILLCVLMTNTENDNFNKSIEVPYISSNFGGSLIANIGIYILLDSEEVVMFELQFALESIEDMCNFIIDGDVSIVIKSADCVLDKGSVDYDGNTILTDCNFIDYYSPF
jgi:hypothetical protein